MSEKFESTSSPEIPKEKYYVYIELETKDFEYAVFASSEEEAENLATEAVEKQGLSVSYVEVEEKPKAADHLDGKLGDESKEGQNKYYVFCELGTRDLEFEVNAGSKEKAEEIAVNETYKRGLRVAYSEVNKKPKAPDHLDGKLE